MPYYRGTPVKEAAKHLRLTVTRFLAELVSFEDVHEAMEILRNECRKADQ